MSGLERVRALNDTFRQSLKGGRLVATCGVAGRPDLNQLIERVRAFSQFTEDNDPHGEHDFGAFLHDGDCFYWKIDYYDPSMVAASPDPADEAQTLRVLTIMLAQDY
jgi:hypothetical protein